MSKAAERDPYAPEYVEGGAANFAVTSETNVYLGT